jgi:hypothetical protein
MSEPFRLARLQVWPAATATRDDVARGFGPACTSATLTAMTDDHWVVAAVFDARLAPDARLLLQHAQDDRLWSSWLEAQCSMGRCRVIAQQASASATPVPAPTTPTR